MNPLFYGTRTEHSVWILVLIMKVMADMKIYPLKL